MRPTQHPCGSAGVHDDADVGGPGRDGLHLGALAHLLASGDHVPEGHDRGVAGEPSDRRRFYLGSTQKFRFKDNMCSLLFYFLHEPKSVEYIHLSIPMHVWRKTHHQQMAFTRYFRRILFNARAQCSNEEPKVEALFPV